MNIDLMPKGQEDCLHYALRYALPRQTGAGDTVRSEIKRLMNQMRGDALGEMANEIAGAIARGEAGGGADVYEWGNFRYAILKYLDAEGAKC